VGLNLVDIDIDVGVGVGVANAPNGSTGRPQGNFRFRTQYSSTTALHWTDKLGPHHKVASVVKLLFISYPRATDYASKLEKPLSATEEEIACACLRGPKQRTCAPPPPLALTHDGRPHPTVTHRIHDSLEKSFSITKFTTAVPLQFYSLFFSGMSLASA
jgi:hypothetical protein